jgi:hypothetical protein
MKAIYNTKTVIDNIEEVLIQIPSSVYKEAKEWYPKANKIALDFSSKYGKPIEVTSALIACLSPQKEWFHNLELTEDFLKVNGKRVRHTRQQHKKAKSIYFFHEDYKDVLSFIEQTLGGPKTQNFFRNILDPTDPKYVTIDSHMAQLMSGNFDYVDPTLKQYNFLKDLLIDFSKSHNMIPSEMQSILWLTWRKIKKKNYEEVQSEVSSYF